MLEFRARFNWFESQPGCSCRILSNTLHYFLCRIEAKAKLIWSFLKECKNRFNKEYRQLCFRPFYWYY
jgi:hypothetical protein